MPDVIVTTTIWLYWIASLLADMSEALQAPGRQAALFGVPQAVLDQGAVFSPGRGTFRGVVPVLRNPVGFVMDISGRPGEGSEPLLPPAPPAPWRWSDLINILQPAGPLGAGLVADRGQPTAGECAAAAAIAYGADFGTPPQLDRQQALAAWTEILPLFTPNAKAFNSPGSVSVSAGHLLSPYRPSGDLPPGFSLVGQRWWPIPVPAGPLGRATPVAHVVAGVGKTAAHPDAAVNFVASLVSAEGQQRLRPWNGGLLLRPADALAQLAQDHPEVQRPKDWVDATADLTPLRLWASPLTDHSGGAVYAAADAFDSALRMFGSAHAASDVRRIADAAQQALMSTLGTVEPLRLGTC